MENKQHIMAYCVECDRETEVIITIEAPKGWTFGDIEGVCDTCMALRKQGGS